ncbi:MAG: alpha/beta hydrolase [Limisphaerales bacterium]
MHSTLTQILDRLVIRMACAAQSQPGLFPANIEQARELLRQPDFLSDALVPAPELKWISPNYFQFPSLISTPWPENNMVRGKFFPLAKNWPGQPTVILVHGWNDEFGYSIRHSFQAPRLCRAGFNVAMLELPYHLHRRPRAAGAVNDFLSEDLFCTIQAAQQAFTDIRAMVAWLSAQGCAQINLWGVSLGGWLSGLVLAHEDKISGAVLNVPVARMDRVIEELAFCAPLRRSLQGHSLDFEKLNLRARRPKISPENILIIEAQDDLFSPPESIEEFWLAWNQPEIWRIRHAHISGLFSIPMTHRIIKWLLEKRLSRGGKS